MYEELGPHFEEKLLDVATNYLNSETNVSSSDLSGVEFQIHHFGRFGQLRANFIELLSCNNSFMVGVGRI